VLLLQVRYVKGLDISGAEIAEAERRLGELLAAGVQQTHVQQLLGPIWTYSVRMVCKLHAAVTSKRHHCCPATWTGLYSKECSHQQPGQPSR